ncbi:MAG TPA: hypothetical protein VFE20_07765 [Thermoleophilia bacterium]|nr:hypothetical protein [Thermoleophilia bacterium]
MMGTLARVLAEKKIPTHTDRFRADVQGIVENVGGVLRITRILVHYVLRTPPGKGDEARACLDHYIEGCPAAMSVQGAIAIEHSMEVEERSARATRDEG